MFDPTSGGGTVALRLSPHTGMIQCPRKGGLALERCDQLSGTPLNQWGESCYCTVRRNYLGHMPSHETQQGMYRAKVKLKAELLSEEPIPSILNQKEE